MNDKLTAGMVVLFCLALGGSVGYMAGAGAERQKAIDVGAGVWVTDEETGHKEFVYGRIRKR